MGPIIARFEVNAPMHARHVWRRRGARLVLGAFVALGGMTAGGCGGGVDDSHFTRTPGTVPADAPKTPAEFDAKYPVPNSGDAPKKRGGGTAITNP